VRGDDEAAVRQFIEKFSEAFTRSDADALDRLMAADYTFVTPNGVVQNKKQRLAPMRAGALKYDSVKYEEVGVHLYRDTAVVTSLVVVKGRNRETDISGQFRSTLTLVKIKGLWMLVASQANTIPQR
jgi:uncharacterized protein (TIGR02246 family)